MNEVFVYLIKTPFIKENFSCVSNHVDDSRKAKADRYINEKDRLLSYGAGYLLNKYLPAEKILENENGKPYLIDGPFFNLSHSGECVVLALHPSRDVGIDIQLVNEDKLDTIQYVLSEKERNIIDSNTLFQIWSNKESLIKCTSTGLKDIKKVSGLPLEGVRVVDQEEYFTKSMAFDGYALSLTLKGGEPFNMVIKQITSLEE